MYWVIINAWYLNKWNEFDFELLGIFEDENKAEYFRDLYVSLELEEYGYDFNDELYIDDDVSQLFYCKEVDDYIQICIIKKGDCLNEERL